MKRKNYRVGETNVANCGMKMTIIEYNNYNDITVKFQDNYITKTYYGSFIHGNVTNPNCETKNKFSEQRNKKCRELYEGKSKIMKNGFILKVLEYKDSQHILCEWEIDKSQIVISSSDFNKGYARHPNIDTKNFILKSKYESQEFKLNNGHVAKIIQYNSYNDVTVILDNDYSKTYTSSIYKLNSGIFLANNKKQLKHIGDKYINGQGIPYIITDIYDNRKCVITFPDGFTRNVSLYRSALSKSVRHPIIKKDKRSIFDYHRLTCQFIYSNKTDWYYSCKCNKCGYDEILSARELVELGDHVCEGI